MYILIVFQNSLLSLKIYNAHKQ